MIKEYHFAALVYNEESKQVHCGACGHAVDVGKRMYRAGGRWVCGKCLPGTAEPSECAMAYTLKSAAEQ